MTYFVADLSSQIPNSNLRYELINNGTAYEVRKGRQFNAKSLVIPAKYKGKPVTTIGEVAFYRCRSLTSIKIPNSVITIGRAAFSGCTSLISLKIPNSVSAIEYATFYGCESLTSVKIPNGVTSIGRNAFRDCSSLGSVKIPNRVTSIGRDAFKGCKNLTSVKIPNSVTLIGRNAFRDCSRLSSIEILSSVVKIGKHAFKGCSSFAIVKRSKSIATGGADSFRGVDSLVRVKKNISVIAAVAKSTIYDQDRNKNNRIIKRYATKNSNYKKLLKISRDYNLVMGIRKFKIGEKARNQPLRYQGSYRWKFLTSKDDKKLDQYVKAFANRWNKLPVGFIKKIGLKGVLFVKDLRFGGLKIGAGFGYHEMILFINVVSERTKIDTIEHLYLHELFHIMQIKYYAKRNFIDFRKWKKLNPANQTYYKGGALAMIRNNKHRRNFFFADHPTKGFVNNYAWSDHWHDVTETFCYLMVTNLYHKAIRWTKYDKIIAAKFKYLKKGLKNLYPGLNDGYFKRIHGVGK